MYTDPFVKCAPTEIELMLKELTRVNPTHGFRTAGLMVLKKKLAFYKEGIYYDIAQVDQHPLRTLQIVQVGEDVLICNGSETEILSFNKKVGLILDSETAPDYTRFYLAHRIGPHGKAIVIDTVEDLMLEEEPTPAMRKTLNDQMIPFALNASRTDGGYQMRGTLLIEKTLYSAFVDVNLTGAVSAQMVRVLAEALPVTNRILES